MQHVVKDILDALRESEMLDAAQLDRIVRAHSKRAHDGRRIFAKKHILPFYLRVKAEAALFVSRGTSMASSTHDSCARCR